MACPRQADVSNVKARQNRSHLECCPTLLTHTTDSSRSSDRQCHGFLMILVRSSRLRCSTREQHRTAITVWLCCSSTTTQTRLARVCVQSFCRPSNVGQMQHAESWCAPEMHAMLAQGALQCKQWSCCTAVVNCNQKWALMRNAHPDCKRIIQVLQCLLHMP